MTEYDSGKIEVGFPAVTLWWVDATTIFMNNGCF